MTTQNIAPGLSKRFKAIQVNGNVSQNHMFINLPSFLVFGQENNTFMDWGSGPNKLRIKG